MAPIPTNKKELAVYGGALVIGILIVYFVLRSVKGGISDFFAPEGETSSVNQDNPLDVEPSNLSWPERQYDVFSDTLYEAMNFTGTNWGTILSVFEQLNTADDVNALVNAYGVRTLYVFGIPSAPGNLGQHLVRESTGSWSGVEDVNEILQSKGINFQFS
jgi:hypothetical protein